MSNKVLISAAQMGPSSFSNGQVDKKGNVQRILALLEKAIQEKVKIICFPELSLTHYFAVRMNRNYEGYFDQIPNELTQDIFSLSRESPISIILLSCRMPNLTEWPITTRLGSFSRGN